MLVVFELIREAGTLAVSFLESYVDHLTACFSATVITGWVKLVMLATRLLIREAGRRLEAVPSPDFTGRRGCRYSHEHLERNTSSTLDVYIHTVTYFRVHCTVHR